MFSKVIALCIIAVSAGGTVEKPREENPAYYTSDTSGIYNDGKHAGQILMSSAISDDSNSYANYYTYPTQDLLEEYSKYLHMKYSDEDDPRKNKATNANKRSLDTNFGIPYYDYYNNKDLMQILQKVNEDSAGVENVDNNNIRRADTEEDVIIVNAITLTTTTESNSKYKKHKKGKNDQTGDGQEKKQHKYKPRYNRKHKSQHHDTKNKQTGEKKENTEAKQARNKYLKEQSKHVYHRKHYHHKHKGQDKKKDTTTTSNDTDSNETIEKQESSEHLILNRAPIEQTELPTTTKRVYKSLRGDKHFTTSDLSRGVRITSEESQESREDTKQKVQKGQKKKKRPVKFEDQFQIVRHHHMYHDDDEEHDDHHDEHHEHDDGDDDDDDELDEEDIHFIQKYYKDILKNNTHSDDKHKHKHGDHHEDQHHHDSHEHKHEHENSHSDEHEENHKHTYHDSSNFLDTSHNIKEYELPSSIEDNHEDLQHLDYSNYLNQPEEPRKPKKTSLQEIKDVLFQSGFKQVNVPVSEVIINHHHENTNHPEAYQYQLYQKLPENFNEDIRYANSYDSYQGHDPLASLYQPPLGNEYFVSGEGSNPYENFLQDDNAENCDETSSSNPSTSYVENVQPYAENYNFKYGVDDPQTGDMKTHYETRDGDVVVGEYKFTEADGKVRVVKYKVDKEDGFKAVVLREENGAPETKK